MLILISIDHCYATLKNQGRSLDEQERLDQLERRLESKVLTTVFNFIVFCDQTLFCQLSLTSNININNFLNNSWEKQKWSWASIWVKWWSPLDEKLSKWSQHRIFIQCTTVSFPIVANQLNTFWIDIGLQSLPLWVCNCCYFFAKRIFLFQRLRRWRMIWIHRQTKQQQQQQWAIRVKPTQQQDHQQTTRSPSWKTSDTGDDFLQLCTFFFFNFEQTGADQSSLKMRKWLLCPMWRRESNRI